MMNYKDAVFILNDLGTENHHTDEEYMAAIHRILGMASVNAVSKDTLRNVIIYLMYGEGAFER